MFRIKMTLAIRYADNADEQNVYDAHNTKFVRFVFSLSTHISSSSYVFGILWSMLRKSPKELYYTSTVYNAQTHYMPVFYHFLHYSWHLYVFIRLTSVDPHTTGVPHGHHLFRVTLRVELQLWLLNKIFWLLRIADLSAPS